MSPRFEILMCVLSVVLASPAFADELSTTQRQQERLPADGVAPSPCCGAAIVPAGNFEVEANYSGDGVKGSLVHTSDLTLKYSLTDRVQLQVATRNLFVGGGELAPRAVDGLSPGIKYVFADEGQIAPQMAVSVHGVFPTQNFEGALQTSIDAIAMFYASKEIGQLKLDATASLMLARLESGVVPQGALSLVGTWNFSDHWGVALGSYSAVGDQRLPVDGGAFAALNFSPFPELALTAGAEVGFFQHDRAFSVFAGVAWVPSTNSRIPLAHQDAPRTEATVVASR